MDDLDMRPWWVTSDPNHPIHERDRLAVQAVADMGAVVSDVVAIAGDGIVAGALTDEQPSGLFDASVVLPDPGAA